MKREIFEVTAKIVDANGTFNTLTGYPKAFDSRNYNNDIETARNRAIGEYHEVLGAMYKRDDRQLQLATVMAMNDGLLLAMSKIGAIADLPDPEPEAAQE